MIVSRITVKFSLRLISGIPVARLSHVWSAGWFIGDTEIHRIKQRACVSESGARDSPRNGGCDNCAKWRNDAWINSENARWICRVTIFTHRRRWDRRSWLTADEHWLDTRTRRRHVRWPIAGATANRSASPRPARTSSRWRTCPGRWWAGAARRRVCGPTTPENQTEHCAFKRKCCWRWIKARWLLIESVLENCNIFSGLSIIKCNPKAKQMLSFNHFYPATSYRRIPKEKERDEYIVYGVGHSLWSAIQLPSGWRKKWIVCRSFVRRCDTIVSNDTAALFVDSDDNGIHSVIWW